MLGDPSYINTIVRQKGKTTGCKCKVIHEDGTVSSMDNPKTRCEGTCEQSIFYRSHPLKQFWRRHQPMAEEELDFEGDRCRLIKVACWERIVWSTFSFKEYKYWSRDRELQIRCKQPSPSWKSFANIELGADTTAVQPTRVWTEEAEIQVYEEELEQMKLAAIFANECPRDFLSFSKPGIDSCIYIYVTNPTRSCR